MTPEQQAKNDLMILHLKQAVELGYSIVSPGSSDAVLEAFPKYFADQSEADSVKISDDLEVDDHPMVSHGEGGYWVSTWSWVECDVSRDEALRLEY